jgi:hypothetical protein
MEVSDFQPGGERELLGVDVAAEVHEALDRFGDERGRL